MIYYMPYTTRGTGSYHLTGDLPVRVDDAGRKLTDYSTWDISTSRGTLAGETYYAITGDMKSYLGNAETGRLSIDPNSSLTVLEDTDGNLVRNGFKSLNLSITAGAGTSSLNGAVLIWGWEQDRYGNAYAPKWIQFSGTVNEGDKLLFSGKADYHNVGLKSFDTTQPVSPTNFLPQTFKLTGALGLPQRPALQLMFAVTAGSTTSRTIDAQFNDGSAVINFRGQILRNNETVSKTATVSTTTGLSFSLNNLDPVRRDSVIRIVKDSARVAEIDLKAGMINYVDGSFESVK